MSVVVHMLLARKEARDKLIEEFRTRGATAMERATRVAERSEAFDYYRAEQVLSETAAGLYYLDESRLSELEHREREKSKNVAVAVIAVVGGVIFLITFLGVLGL
jgi:hypothetical protein